MSSAASVPGAQQLMGHSVADDDARPLPAAPPPFAIPVNRRWFRPPLAAGRHRLFDPDQTGVAQKGYPRTALSAENRSGSSQIRKPSHVEQFDPAALDADQSI